MTNQSNTLYTFEHEKKDDNQDIEKHWSTQYKKKIKLIEISNLELMKKLITMNA
jgi:hypothetical protein